MNKPISRKTHGVTDYTYVPFTMFAPQLIGFTSSKTASLLCKALSATILASSIVTRAEWGLIKKMPFKNHLLIDTIGAATALAAPWLFGFAKNKRARNTFIVMGLFGLMAGLLSRPEEMPDTRDEFNEAAVTLPPL